MYNAFKVSCFIDVLRTNWRYLYLLLKHILYAYLVDDKYLNWLHMVIFRFGVKNEESLQSNEVINYIYHGAIITSKKINK